MSAPDTNIEKQKRRHKGPLIGIALALIVVVGFMAFWSFSISANGGNAGAQQPAPVTSGTGG